jgi:hypothetical protein
MQQCAPTKSSVSSDECSARKHMYVKYLYAWFYNEARAPSRKKDVGVACLYAFFIQCLEQIFEVRM